jgi:TrmH family RNA methyltransferase
MKSISSRQNPFYKRVREAIRDHAGEIVLEGPKSIAGAIAGGWKPLLLLRRDGSSPLAAELPRGAAEIVVAPALFDSLAPTKTSQGVIALFERPPQGNLFARSDSVVVALDGVQDPGNVGTIVRLAAAFDAAGVALLPGCADPFSPKAIRASAGATLAVPISTVTPEELLASGWPLFAADAGGAATEPPPRGAILVFGNEGAGVRPEWKANAIAIPMSDRVESLNVAASAAILLARSYALRQSQKRQRPSA